jgi:hypothetical protein
MRYLLLIIPCILALIAPAYNKVEPRLFGFPFFYWYLLLLIPVSSVFIYAFFKGDEK